MLDVLDHSDVLWRASIVTASTASLTIALATLLGIAVMALRMTPAASILAKLYVEVFQNVPYPILVFIIYYGLPEVGLVLGPIESTILGIGVYSSAYIAEALRSGVLAVPNGQYEAGQSTGLSHLSILRHVILRQAVVAALPSLTNQWCRALRNISVMAIIGGQEILFASATLASQTFEVLSFYLVAGIVYWVLSIPIVVGAATVAASSKKPARGNRNRTDSIMDGVKR